eukprot:CAMPEP_0180076762 /NCGR_PEP_ID=MMETSP0985-20121206/15299_1 /TAXON_ID=483367 /ORGANISM="non described non described, Strain CCMP 2436" /LENGTH=355 /DNA_ID=CAMNT_0022008975 /DNA_START=327 /DNA_END=1395 /DNA_ORIENTATION=-
MPQPRLRLLSLVAVRLFAGLPRARELPWAAVAAQHAPLLRDVPTLGPRPDGPRREARLRVLCAPGSVQRDLLGGALLSALLDVHGAMSGSDPAGTGPDGEALQIDPAAVIEAVTRGLRAGCAAHPGIVVNQILCCISFRPEWAESTVEHAHRRRVDVPCAVVGVDIAAGEDALDPATNPESFRLHSQAFARARSLGLNITLHAGEEGVSKNVQTALDVFGASRIGHGYAAARDTAQLEACISAGVHFEVCPTSSYATSGWLNGGSGNGNGPDWSTHPLRTFVERGLSVSISTDDPSVFDTTLEEEYALSEARVGLSAAQLVECTMCAARAAFVGEDERAALCETIAQAARRLQLI